MPEKVKQTLCDAILLTLCYREVFDYPMTRQELLRYLLFHPASLQELDQALAQMDRRQITLSGDYVLPIGNESLLAVRETRERAHAAYWHWALRYARWLRWVPFIRMVGITGSLAANNTDPAADIDLFCITSAGRMWVGRLGMSIIKKITRRFCPFPACLNTCVSEANLNLSEHNVYIAHQIALMVPVWGERAYRDLLAANPWVTDYFPQLDFKANKTMYEQRPPLPVRFVEWLLRGRFGNWLNTYTYHLGVRRALRGVQHDNRQSLRKPEDHRSIVERSRQSDSFWLLHSHLPQIHQRFMECWQTRAGDRHSVYDLSSLMGLHVAIESPATPPENAIRQESNAQYYRAVGDHFNDDAVAFSSRYHANLTLQRMRNAFRDITNRYPFQQALEIGIGPGLDLEYWARKKADAQLFGIDVSSGMVAEAEQRMRQAGLNNVRCAIGSVDDIAKLCPRERFDLVYVYFGALNTVTDLRAAARAIHGCMADDGVAVITFVNRWYLQEISYYLLTFRWKRAFARLRHTWGGYASKRPLDSHCYSPKKIRRSFGPLLRIVRKEGYCILHPAWYRDKWVRRLPRLCNILWHCDRLLSRTHLWCYGEYALYVFEPRKYVVNGCAHATEAERATNKEISVP